jgi:hypothetical protein
MSIKSAWAYRHGLRMEKEFRKKKPDKITFIQRERGCLYAEYGMVKVYANKSQAEKKITTLRSLGYAVERSESYPYVIIAQGGKT